MRVAATATTGVYSTRTSSQIRTGSVLTVGPARKTDSTTSSKEVTKAKTPPPTTPGRISGKVTVRNTRHGPAPSPGGAAASAGSRAAATRRRSAPRRAGRAWCGPTPARRVVPTQPRRAGDGVERDGEHDHRHHHRAEEERGQHGVAGAGQPLRAPSAAAVPSTTESAAASSATSQAGQRAPRRHDGSAKKAPHQRSDHVSGGSWMKLLSLNATGTTARIGSTRKAATSAANRSSSRRAVSAGLGARAADRHAREKRRRRDEQQRRPEQHDGCRGGERPGEALVDQALDQHGERHAARRRRAAPA